MPGLRGLPMMLLFKHKYSPFGSKPTPQGGNGEHIVNPDKCNIGSYTSQVALALSLGCHFNDIQKTVDRMTITHHAR